MPAYREMYAVGTRVQIAELSDLELFRATWRHHNSLSTDQLKYAGQPATVREVGFYHGGDVLYQLDGAPGTWHESCLRADGGARAV